MNRVAIVTGSSSGIGRALAERLADGGWQVFAFSRPSDHFEAAKASWRDRPGLRPVPGDVRQDPDVDRLVATVRAETDRLDLLVNNAGAYFAGDGELPELAVLEENLETNTIGPYRLIRACVPLLEAAPEPVIVNVSSGAAGLGAVAGPGPLGYRTSKAALNMLTRSLAFALAGRGIAVHAVDPGYIKTRLNPDGTGSPEAAVDGIWPLLTRHDLAASGQFWHGGQVLPW